MIDCLERKIQSDGKGKWESLNSLDHQFADEWCGKIDSLKESALSEYADGSANEKDILAIKTLPSKSTGAIKMTTP